MKKITNAITFLYLLFMLFSFVNVSSVSATTCILPGIPPGCGGYGGGLDLSDNHGLPTGTIRGIVENALNWLLGLFAVLGILGFVISGIFYLTSAGDEGQIDRAKTAMMYSIVGIIVGLLGVVILQAVQSLLDARTAVF